MSNDSLIDRISQLPSCSFTVDPGKMYLDRDVVMGIIKSANPSLAEGYYLPKGHPDHPYTSEISVPLDDEDLLFIATSAFEKVQPKAWDFSEDAVQAVIDAVRPHLATREPVSVSLEPCNKAVQEIIQYTYEGLEGQLKPECVSKAVLDAAGVSYVD